ncbi:MAG: hypothetical protein EOO11_14190 [Chitinophagaceae bacterium]|nr:MAG: hypothetical protein EOO11_14190 [Chitinophagaceae bacterium]
MRPVLLLCLLILAKTVSAQPTFTDSTLWLRPLYRVGDRLTYRVSTHKEFVYKEQPAGGDAEYRVTVEVRQADSLRGYVLDYSVKLVSATDTRRPVYSLQAQALDGLRFSYRLNRYGTYGGLLDTMAVRNYLEQRLAGIAKPAAWTPGDEKGWQRELDAFRHDRELREYLAPLGLIHSGNRRLWRTQPRRVPAHRLRIHSGDTTRGGQDLWLERIDRERNTAIYRMAFQGADRTKSGAGMVTMDYEYAVELSTGWLQRLYAVQRQGGVTGFRTILIELLPAS